MILSFKWHLDQQDPTTFVFWPLMTSSDLQWPLTAKTVIFLKRDLKNLQNELLIIKIWKSWKMVIFWPFTTFNDLKMTFWPKIYKNPETPSPLPHSPQGGLGGVKKPEFLVTGNWHVNCRCGRNLLFPLLVGQVHFLAGLFMDRELGVGDKIQDELGQLR